MSEALISLYSIPGIEKNRQILLIGYVFDECSTNRIFDQMRKFFCQSSSTQVDDCLVINFNFSRFSFSSQLTDQQNREIFGKCNNVNGHGHNYKIKVTVRKSVDPVTGMAMNLNDLKLHLQKVTEELDHKNLDKDVGFFQTHTSTAENIAYYVWSKLQATCECLYEVKIKETENNYVIYRGERG